MDFQLTHSDVSDDSDKSDDEDNMENENYENEIILDERQNCEDDSISIDDDTYSQNDCDEDGYDDTQMVLQHFYDCGSGELPEDFNQAVDMEGN